MDIEYVEEVEEEPVIITEDYYLHPTVKSLTIDDLHERIVSGCRLTTHQEIAAILASKARPASKVDISSISQYKIR